MDLEQCSTAILQYCRTSGNLRDCPGLVVVLDQPLLHAARQLQQLLDQGGAQVLACAATTLTCLALLQL